ncbi:MAG: amidohydrolase family protein, partial [Verrucomicrobiota bacterium]|nr:amidohydrolase family protein [Verrucomicrobiota bacterium]
MGNGFEDIRRWTKECRWPGATVNRNPNRRVVRAKLLSATVAALLSGQTPHLCRADDSTEGAERPIVAIENVSVVDVVQGRIAGPRTLLIVDGRISAIDKPGAVVLPPTAVRVDGREHYLMPALVDMHVHLFNNATHRPPNDWTFPLFVANGVTAVREMAAVPADMPIINRWRAAVKRGDLIAPRVLAAGIPVNADSPEAVRRLVREAHAAGADFIKVFSDVRESHWRALLDEARAQRMPLCGHVPAEVSVLTAANAGQRSNEHLTQIYEACSAREQQFLAQRQGLDGKEAVKLRDAQEREVLESFDQRLCDRTARALAKTGQVQVPTLVLPHFERGERVEFRDDPRWRHLRPDEQTRWEHYLEQEPALDKKLAAQRRDVSRRIVKALHAAGVPILAGTDAPMPLVYPGFSLHKELELLVESGLSPAEALR